jgi:predicted SprT family Zn-dependent metalloprotease
MLSIPERYARRVEVRKLALELLARHGLHDWTFALNRRKRTLGLCRYDARTVELSIHLVDRNGPEEIRDTILHEIAHALVGPGHAHDAVWRAKAVEVGARPERCGQAEMPAGRWRAHCGGCGQAFSRHRRPERLRGWFCRECGPERGKLTWRAGSRGPSG